MRDETPVTLDLFLHHDISGQGAEDAWLLSPTGRAQPYRWVKKSIGERVAGEPVLFAQQTYRMPTWWAQKHGFV